MKLVVKDTEGKGRGVYAAEFVRAGLVLLEFVGPLVTADKVPFPLLPEQDFYTQVGKNVFRGPTSELDNTVNHSCDPNCRVVVDEYDAYLVSMRDIVVGEEVTWDYSTTSTDDPSIWSLRCLCGTPKCRGTISGFQLLPAFVQAFYVEREAVPDYVLDTLGYC